MSSDRTVLEHLLDGRNALVLEVRRLTTAIEELDSVIARIGGGEPRSDDTAAPVPSPSLAETVNPPVEVEAAGPAPARKAPPAKSAARARKAPARAAAPRSTTRRAPDAGPASEPKPGAPKSIRVHVLEMLAAEDRDFGLAEIIDRIHAEGIQAHDDAVRSITIKLMKDGRVERVGRGLYRLTRRGSSAAAATPPATPSEPAAGYVPPLDLGQSWQRPGS